MTAHIHKEIFRGVPLNVRLLGVLTVGLNFRKRNKRMKESPTYRPLKNCVQGSSSIAGTTVSRAQTGFLTTEALKQEEESSRHVTGGAGPHTSPGQPGCPIRPHPLAGAPAPIDTELGAGVCWSSSRPALRKGSPERWRWPLSIT